MKQVHLIISGMVHGVFFRDHTRGIALKLGLKGFVRNTPNGKVEVVAQGNEKGLQQLIHFCRMGPPAAHVEDVDVKYEEMKDLFSDFSVRY